MNLIDLDAIQLATDKQPYDDIVATIKNQFLASVLTDNTDSKTGAPLYRDLIEIYARLVTLQDACQQFITEHKQDIQNEVHRLHPNEAAKGQAFEHNGGRFVLRTRPTYNFLEYDVPEIIRAKNGKAIRRRVLARLYDERDAREQELKKLKGDIRDREQHILRENGNRMKPTEIQQILSYI